MKKLCQLTAFISAFFLAIVLFSSVANATELQEYAPSYTLYSAFIRNSYPEICNGERMYLTTVEESENDTFLFINQGWLLDRASWILDKDLDTDRCIEILTNTVTLINQQLEEGIVKQSTENTRQQIIDFALDTVGVVTGFVGMDDSFEAVTSDILRNIPLITGVAADTLDLTIDSIEELEILNQLLGDYTMQYEFLNAVATYADLKPMREAAQTILEANEQILLYKLDTFADVSEITARYLAEDIFIDKVAEEMLKDPSNFSGKSTMFAASTAVGAYQIVAQAKLAFDLTLLIGDGLFGTNNTYQQYNEMKAMRDIRYALIESIDSNSVSGESDVEQMSRNIELLKALQYVDAWGEACVYTTVKNEGTFIGDIWPRDTSIMDRNYQNSIDYFSFLVEQLDSIYIDKTTIAAIPPPEIITEKDQTNSIYQYVEAITGGYCKWLAEGDFNNDDTSEVYAYISLEESNNTEGEIWYLSDDENHRIFWLTDGECTFFLNIFDLFSDSASVTIINLIDFIDNLLSNN